MSRLFRIAVLSAAGFAATTLPAWGHEAWLLTPSEIARLSITPMPALFTSTLIMGLAALVAAGAAAAAVFVENKVMAHEDRLLSPIANLAGEFGPLLIRIGLAIMLALGALGGLPRNGTALWSQPVLFVPDMQLNLVPGYEWLAVAEFIVAILLAFGFMTRAAASFVIALACMGIAVFGFGFVSYAPHFIAPALVLVVWGSGAFGMDRFPAFASGLEMSDQTRQIIWRVVMFLTGATFVYLGIAVKLAEPTLLMAILDHGEVPTLGVPLAVIALAMAMVEIVAGGLLAAGRLVRPVALFLIFAFSFFAVTIGETPLFHANLYGLALMLAMAGRKAPAQSQTKTFTPRIARTS